MNLIFLPTKHGRRDLQSKLTELPDTFLEDKTYGYPRTFDPNFKGPVAKRSCTDVLCCIIFILFIIAYILLGLVAWVHGDPRRVAYPTDSKGHFCGQKGTPNENKTVLFYFNLFSCTSPSVVVNLQCPTTQICVSKCPEKFLTYMEIQFAYRTNKHYWTYYSQFCKSPFVKPAKTLAQVLLDDDCPTAIFPSKPFLQRCFPDFTTKNGTLTVGNKTTFEDGNGKTRNAIELRTAANRVNKILDARAIGMKVFEDYATTWYWILIGLTVAMLLSWMFVILLRFIAGVLFWVFMVGVIGIIGYGIWHCYQEHSNLQGRPNSHLTIYDIGIQTDISMYFQLKQTWFAFMIILCLLEVFIILMLIFLRERIRISVALLKEGSKAIGYLPTTLIYPVLTFIFLSICIAYWAVTAIYLATSGVPVYKVISPEGKCKHENTTCDPECALAGAFASYYWALKKPDDIPPYPLFTAFGRAIRYHTGSLAFGSLILALVQMFKFVLEYLDRRLKEAQNNISKFLQCCLKCCFWCVEKMVKFFNRNAYVMIAIYGKNFCRSARDAFNLLMRNVLKVAVMDKVTDFVLILGKILVAGCIGVLAFLLFTHRLPTMIEGPTSLNYYWIPLLTVIIGSYLVAHGFFSVYAMCIDTIFICFCEDLERNDGSTEKPYFIAPTLHGTLNRMELVSQKQKE
ncbi:choline transporter-like protein 5 isoform X6 [Ursus americanus]|uniref:choline transporter-like protein 5 isoform X6 n=1 Tax=Ursus americanus TaxID=9643 RepID=UPI001E67DAD4|nr:choline transporter-like protein 5 isoform X6 [Ursus americanus]